MQMHLPGVMAASVVADNPAIKHVRYFEPTAVSNKEVQAHPRSYSQRIEMPEGDRTKRFLAAQRVGEIVAEENTVLLLVDGEMAYMNQPSLLSPGTIERMELRSDQASDMNEPVKSFRYPVIFPVCPGRTWVLGRGALSTVNQSDIRVLSH